MLFSFRFSTLSALRAAAAAVRATVVALARRVALALALALALFGPALLMLPPTSAPVVGDGGVAAAAGLRRCMPSTVDRLQRVAAQTDAHNARIDHAACVAARTERIGARARADIAARTARGEPQPNSAQTHALWVHYVQSDCEDGGGPTGALSREAGPFGVEGDNQCACPVKQSCETMTWCIPYAHVDVNVDNNTAAAIVSGGHSAPEADKKPRPLQCVRYGTCHEALQWCRAADERWAAVTDAIAQWQWSAAWAALDFALLQPRIELHVIGVNGDGDGDGDGGVPEFVLATTAPKGPSSRAVNEL